MNTGDAEKLAAMWTKAQPTVAGFIRAMVGNAEQAEEVLQETAMACVCKFDTYDPSRPFGAWAVGVARYEVFAWRRSQATAPRMLDDRIVDRVAESFQRLSEQADEVRESLTACLDEISGRSRRSLYLFYEQGKKTDQIAADLEMTGAAVRTLLSRTRAALRKCIERRLALQQGSR